MEESLTSLYWKLICTEVDRLNRDINDKTSSDSNQPIRLVLSLERLTRLSDTYSEIQANNL
jgi:hypothetical protein